MPEARSVRTTCAYCGVGCGVIASVANGQVTVAGDPDHPANFGRLCSKGLALHETLGLEGRLLQPMLGKQATDWDTALNAVAQGFRRCIEQHGPESVAFYVSGQLLTEDYYLANKLMKGYIGAANIDTNSRLCMSSAVMGYKRAFGEDLVPNSYADVGAAELVVLAGANAAWCHPIVYQRIAAAKAERPGMRVVVIDPRRTASCDIADLHLSLNPGSDVLLFNGLLTYLHEHGCMDAAFVDQHCTGADAALRLAAATARDVQAVANGCGLREADVLGFYRLFAECKRTLTLFSQGVNQSSQGTDKVNAIINCHLLTGRIGHAGMGPFSITGQPNAMGGREVGGMATTLAAHMDIDNAGQRDLLQRFWNSPSLCTRPGLKAVELFEAMHAGHVKAVWIMATNPVVSLPDANRVREALGKCELVVCSEVMADTDTTRLAHVRLPALAWGEKDGTVTNSERRISRQRAFLPAPGQARADWWMIAEVARRMGFAGFDYSGPAAIFAEHARLSGVGNVTGSKTRRGFNIAALATLAPAEYDALAPIQWPVMRPKQGTERLFSDGQFYTASGRAQFVPVSHQAPANTPGPDWPLALNTGRIRDQWHGMTRSGKSARLAGHRPEPFVQLHAQDAMLYGVQEAALARVSTPYGNLIARVMTSSEIPRGQLFVPIHWNSTTASDARVGALVNPVVDPVSGQPELKHTPARIEPFLVDWHGFALTRRPLEVSAHAYWVKVQGEQFLRYELAGRGVVADWPAWGRSLIGAGEGEDLLEVSDPSAGVYRAALVQNSRIEACVFVSPRPDLPSRAWLSGLFAKNRLEAIDRVSLLVGQPADPAADAGPLVCSCFGVGRNTITRAIQSEGLDSVKALGDCLKAGSNCGSCVPELKKLLAQVLREAA